MPKTAMNEDDLSAFREDKIGFSWQVRYVEPESMSTRTCNFPHQEFRFGILASDERHPLAALNPVKRVHRRRTCRFDFAEWYPMPETPHNPACALAVENLHWRNTKHKQNDSLFHRLGAKMTVSANWKMLCTLLFGRVALTSWVRVA